MKCKDHPLATHGFNREVSFSMDDYVCDCLFFVEPAWYEEIFYGVYLSGYEGADYITLTDTRNGGSYDIDIEDIEELLEKHKRLGRAR